MELLTNGGINKNEYTGTVPGFGNVWINKFALANIFGFTDLKDKFRITYKSEVEDAFNVHLPGKIIKFKEPKKDDTFFKSLWNTKKKSKN